MRIQEFRESAQRSYRYFLRDVATLQDGVMHTGSNRPVDEGVPDEILGDLGVMSGYFAAGGSRHFLTKHGEGAAESHHLGIRWASWGCPTFTLTHDTVAAAILTDCGNLSVDDLVLPFPVLALQLPHPALVSMTDQRGEKVDVGFVLVHAYNDLDRDGATDVDEWSDVIAHYDEPRRPVVSIQSFSAGDSLRTALTRIVRGRDLVRDWMEALGDRSLCNMNDYTNEKFGYFGSTMKIVIRLVANVLAYINDLKTRGEIDTTPLSRVTPTTKPRIYRLPSPTKLGPELIRAAKECNGNNTLWHLKTRFVVRGHWRNQACGKNLAERKQRWIQPHWKGPKDGEVIARTYKVVHETLQVEAQEEVRT